MQISIIDTGIGISQDGLQNLFIDFSKLHENSSRNKGGTGLGLSICKKIIEQMGGKVEVESKLGVGTSFIINMKTRCKVKNTNFVRQFKEKINCGDSFNFLEQDPVTKELISIIDNKNIEKIEATNIFLQNLKLQRNFKEQELFIS